MLLSRNIYRLFPYNSIHKIDYLLKENATNLLPVRLTAKHVKPHKKKGAVERPRHFVDYVEVTVRGGNGGNGMVSFSSLPNLEWAGPDGGNGGNGGHVILKASHNVKSLAHLKSFIAAPKGVKGKTRQRDGKNAAHLTIEVPLGTIVKSNTGQVLISLDEADAMFIAARGGAGGKGNYFYLSNENRAPTIAETGGLGQERELHVELKIMAHAGLVGFPNAGKSSLLQAISRAQPKVSPYPFTTLNPHIGMVLYDDHEQLAVADIPGLIPGSHMNKGLGHSFLRHIERCLCLVYVIDLALDQPWEQLQQLCYELNQYKPGLADRPALLVANKLDLPGAQDRMERLKEWLKSEHLKGMGENGKMVHGPAVNQLCKTTNDGDNGCVSKNIQRLKPQSDEHEVDSFKIDQTDACGALEGEKIEEISHVIRRGRLKEGVLFEEDEFFKEVNVMDGRIDGNDNNVRMMLLGVSAKSGIGIDAFLHHLRVVYDSYVSSMNTSKLS